MTLSVCDSFLYLLDLSAYLSSSCMTRSFGFRMSGTKLRVYRFNYSEEITEYTTENN